MRFPLAILDAVRAVVPAGYPVGFRISGTDWVEGGWDIEQSIAFSAAAKARGADFIDMSGGGLSATQKIPLGPSYQVPLARAVKQVDLAFIFANYALEAGIDTDKALLVEKGSDLYVEYLVARPDNIQDPGIQKLAQALHSDAVRQFILTRYQGKILPGF